MRMKTVAKETTETGAETGKEMKQGYAIRDLAQPYYAVYTVLVLVV